MLQGPAGPVSPMHTTPIVVDKNMRKDTDMLPPKEAPKNATKAKVGSTSTGWLGLDMQIILIAQAASLVFGGCCTNVLSQEYLVKLHDDVGVTLTFLQFTFTACASFFLLPPKRAIPMYRWFLLVAIFTTSCLLNNIAVGAGVSMPLQIVLRSATPAASLILGKIFMRKAYSLFQIVGVLTLIAGVIMVTWTNKPLADNGGNRGVPYLIGSVVLIAVLALAEESLFKQYTFEQPSYKWRESLFFSHALALPTFLINTPKIYSDLVTMSNEAYIHMLLNVSLQFVCILGVKRLAGTVTALTLSLVLTGRKVASLLLSVTLFGHSLSVWQWFGAMAVMLGGYTYGRASQRKNTAKEAAEKHISKAKTS